MKPPKDFRRPSCIKQSKGSRRPKHVIFFDTETHISRNPDGSEYHTLKLGFLLFTELDEHNRLQITDELEFTTVKEFNDYVVKKANKHDKIYLVSHNIVYDIAATHSLVELPHRGYKLTSLYSKATTTLIRLQSNKRRVWLLDNSNFFIGKLETLAELTDFPKIKIDLENCTDEELMVYCRRDVEIVWKLWNIWLSFLDEHDIGNFKMTTSSTAFEAYRHKFIPHSIDLHTDEKTTRLERDSYHGGRVECKFIGAVEGDMYYVDVNSMYPYVMREYEYPYRWYYTYTNPDLRLLKEKLERYCCTARVVIRTEKNAFPGIVNDRLCYPVGEFETVMSTPELKYAIEHCEIVEIKELAIYAKEKLFTSYVDYFYPLRQRYRAEGNRAFEKIVKLLGNGLYGKFGQKGMEQEILEETNPERVEIVYHYNENTKEYYTDTTIGGVTIRTTESEIGSRSFVAIAAHVTAHARMYLWSLIEQVPKGHYFYCDTDSLIVDTVGKYALDTYLENSGLGGLKIEQHSSWVGILAPKCYNMENRLRLKGIKKDATLIDWAAWKQKRWPKLGSMIAHYGVTDYKLFPVQKTLSFANETVNVSASGWTSPLRVGLPE